MEKLIQYNGVVQSLISVPSNSSRLFSSIDEAKSQPTSSLRLESFIGQTKEGYLFNGEFDSTKIKHDGSYCSENRFHEERSWENIQNILQRLSRDFPNIQVIDIGCGQGEIVSKCENIGISAIGFDPTLRQSSRNLLKQYFSAESLKGNTFYNSKALHVFIMRCVLPHISDPFEFVNQLFNIFPTDLIYIEFQNLDKILKSMSWYSFMHDHVNYFAVDSFQGYTTLDYGHFGEWSWVFFGAGSFHIAAKDSFIGRLRNSVSISKQPNSARSKERDWTVTLAEAERCIQYREKNLKQISSEIEDLPLIVYSAAGKGINFCYAAVISGLFGNITAVDISENRHGKFMECSGVQVLSINEFSKGNNLAAAVVILNREHLAYARNKLDHLQLFIALPRK